MTDGFIKHDGKGMPVPPETMVVIKFHDGQVSPPREARIGGSCWSHSSMAPHTNIVAYQFAPNAAPTGRS